MAPAARHVYRTPSPLNFSQCQNRISFHFLVSFSCFSLYFSSLCEAKISRKNHIYGCCHYNENSCRFAIASLLLFMFYIFLKLQYSFFYFQRVIWRLKATRCWAMPISASTGIRGSRHGSISLAASSAEEKTVWRRLATLLLAPLLVSWGSYLFISFCFQHFYCSSCHFWHKDPGRCESSGFCLTSCNAFVHVDRKFPTLLICGYFIAITKTLLLRP